MRNLRLLIACTAIFTLGFVANCGDDAKETNCTDQVDNDGDGVTDCADSDCDGNQACQSGCNNNNLCEPAAGENATNCPNDCGSAPVCGNGTCETGEDSTNCLQDCPVNPCNNDGDCDAGETTANCPADCSGSDECVADADVLADNGCAMGETCDLAAAVECRATGAVANYAACTASTDCGANAGCYSLDGTTFSCLPYCDIQNPPATCPGAAACAGGVENHPSLGLCLETSDECDPVDNTGCTAPDACYIVSTGASCAATTASPGQPGEACDNDSPSGCVAGSSCFMPTGGAWTCMEVCVLAGGAGCTTGSCSDVISSTTYGVCQ
jgi:hypothetical protein